VPRPARRRRQTAVDTYAPHRKRPVVGRGDRKTRTVPNQVRLQRSVATHRSHACHPLQKNGTPSCQLWIMRSPDGVAQPSAIRAWRLPVHPTSGRCSTWVCFRACMLGCDSRCSSSLQVPVYPTAPSRNLRASNHVQVPRNVPTLQGTRMGMPPCRHLHALLVSRAAVHQPGGVL
jgi:hypothetical protein